ncbi:MAG TPA: altronate dehydratase family protein [Chthonomonadales bacterium]|nr:altronate dehydratase family protein [Chthonomonadales bacterium]
MVCVTPRVMLLREGDDVAVALAPILAGEALDEYGVRCADGVPAGHKVALRPIAEGDAVRKYGEVIGRATRPIAPGGWVHTHNLSADHVGSAAWEPGVPKQVEREPLGVGRTFDGYRAPGGRSGTRNWIAIISSSNCSADAVHLVAERLRREVLRDHRHIDGVMAVTHATGCGLLADGPEHVLLRRCLNGVLRHPNVAGAVVIGLGCEVNQPREMLEPAIMQQHGARHPPPVLVIQEQGGVGRTVDAALEAALPIVRRADARRRTARPLSDLVVGTNCGGSDAYSGITANPALGIAGDLLVGHGASWVLAETPETYGAEHLLIRRAASRKVGESLLGLLHWWEQHAARHGAVIDNNPAPGNKVGGITTIQEKSLGAVTKGGSSPLMAVYEYAQTVEERGLCFMDTPGHDPVSVTGLLAGGCALIAFTTGRGSCIGLDGVPVLKIASTSDLFHRLSDDMDVDAGVALGGVALRDLGRMIAEELIAVASGKRTKAEVQGLGRCAFVPWALGPVL